MKETLKRLVPYAAVRYVREIMFRFRRATWFMRSLPDFIIVGAQKAGTSSLHAFLCQHPRIVPAREKEVHFFCGGMDPDVNTYAMGEPWYRAHFPLRDTLASNQVTFEATPLYMHNPLVAGRISKLVPNAKLVMLLRNPTERAISHYFHERRKGKEDLGIDAAMRSEESRLDPYIEAQDYKSDVFRRHSYKMRGLYRQQLSMYLEHFRREQILVLSSERFFQAPERVLKRVFEFVGVDPDYEVPDLLPQNLGTNRTNVEPSVYEYLDEFFRRPNAELYDMLGEDYGW